MYIYIYIYILYQRYGTLILLGYSKLSKYFNPSKIANCQEHAIGNIALTANKQKITISTLRLKSNNFWSQPPTPNVIP